MGTGRRFKDWAEVKAADLGELLREARELSWERHGKVLRCFIPGRMMWNHMEGRYPTISITGSGCALNCDHCQTKILETMVPATTPERLCEACTRAVRRGDEGVLISGGSQKDGSLPWKNFLGTIRRVKDDTGLRVTVHTGQVDEAMALALRDAGVDELLIDVIGDEDTLREIYHLNIGLDRMEASLSALEATGLSLTPHIVFGLHRGEVRGEMTALEMVARHNPYSVVVVVLIPIKGSPMEGVPPPQPEDVARFLAAVRLRLPDVPVALSCARPTGRHREALDVLAVEAGVNRIAMPAEEAVEKARGMGLEVEFYHTCCSKSDL